MGGMPTVEYYDPNGNLAQQTQATECAADGSWISGPTPDLSECATGAYTLIVRNAEGEAVGSAVVTVFNFLPPCNSDPEAVSNCEAINYFWNYDNCTCVDHIN